MTRRRFVLGLIASVSILTVLESCAGAPPAASPQKPTIETSQPRASRGKVERPGTGLEASIFADLPEGVRAYLERLAQAVREHDAKFLLAQGEPNYARRLRPQLDDETYLALLYRVGPYAVERPTDSERPLRLSAAKLRAIRYTGWDDRGPVVEVRGVLALDGEAPLPCRISVLWKLSEPRLIGQEP
jgi:hypothetical protein